MYFIIIIVELICPFLNWFSTKLLKPTKAQYLQEMSPCNVSGALGSESGWEAFRGETKVFPEHVRSSSNKLGLLTLVGLGWHNNTTGWGA